MNWKKFRRKARRFIRGHRHHLLLAAVIVLVPVLILLAGRRDYQDFLDDLGMRESSDDYTAVNRFGYMGRYQMGSLALREVGFLDESGGWTELANSHGVASQADFLNSPAAQEYAIAVYHRKTCGYIRALGLDEYVGTDYCGVRVTRSGMLAACHLVGIGSMADALEAGEMAYDGNGVSAAHYMELFSGYDISRVWRN